MDVCGVVFGKVLLFIKFNIPCSGYKNNHENSKRADIQMIRYHDGRVYVTGTDPDFYPAKNCQLGSILQNYFRNVFGRYNNNIFSQ